MVAAVCVFAVFSSKAEVLTFILTACVHVCFYMGRGFAAFCPSPFAEPEPPFATIACVPPGLVQPRPCPPVPHSAGTRGAGLPKRIAALERAIVDFCGEHEGSVPSERVQNVIKKNEPELYEVSCPASPQSLPTWHPCPAKSS